MVPESSPASSKPNQCPRCTGTGILIRHVHSNLHQCGFTTEAYTCVDCLGSGRILPPEPSHSTEMP